ncbi:amidohydrolase [Nakamurella silvestris]|nr:amidohydrolase [Nakamurella silvestris]
MTVPVGAIVDTHVHIWDPAGGPFGVRYPWLTPELTALYHPFALADLDAELGTAGVDVSGYVLVQAADSLAETRALLAAAGSASRPTSVVGWLPLADAEAATAALADLAGGPALVGVRHLIHDEPDLLWMSRSEVAAGMDILVEAGLSFDAVAERPELLAQIPAVAQRHSELTIVIDHLGKPPFGTDGFDHWADLLAACAAEPGVVAKISGLATISDEYIRAESWQPAVDHALAVFGPDRLMVGSDWPISGTAGGVHQIWESTLGCLTDLDERDLRQVLSGTAERVYRLAPSGIPQS